MAAALLGLCLAFLVPAAPSGAFGGIDRSFGEDGSVDLRYEPLPGWTTLALDVGTAPDRKIYVLEKTSSCLWNCGGTYYVIRFHPNGRRDWSYAGDGSAELPPVENAFQLLVDSRGRQLVAGGRDGHLAVFRFTRDGHVDPTFAGGGIFDCDCSAGNFHLMLGRSGYLTITESFNQPRESRSGIYQTAVVIRAVGEDGRVDTRFGGEGVASAVLPNTFGVSAPTPLAGGGLAMLATPWSGASFSVLKVGSRGGIDQRYLMKSRQALTLWMAWHEPWVSPTSLVSRRAGQIDVLGYESSQGIVLRLRRDGGIDRRFGRRGVKFLPWKVGEVVPGPGGRVFAMGSGRPESGVVGWLGRNSEPLRSFAGGRGAESLRGSNYFAQAVLQGDRLPVVLEQGALGGCRSVCPPPDPRLVRITSWAPR